jgi:SAM-dependent methyltransferase
MDRDRNVVFAGAIPENYDRYLGPVIFEPYAEDLVSRLKGKKLNRVLEIACGTGIVTRRLRDALPASTEVIATDLNPDMFEFAKRKFKDGENVRWQQADALALPFPDESFDAVVCQFGYMFVPDKAAAMRESRSSPGRVVLIQRLGFVGRESIRSNRPHDDRFIFRPRPAEVLRNSVQSLRVQAGPRTPARSGFRQDRGVCRNEALPQPSSQGIHHRFGARQSGRH